MGKLQAAQTASAGNSRTSADQPRWLVDYTRKSLDKAKTGDGVNSQHEENQELADDFDLGEIARTYCDNDVSAYQDVERPDYTRMLADMQAGKIAVIIIWHAKRLHRRVEEVTRFIKIARAHKVRLFSVSRGGEYNLNKAQGRKDLIDDTSEGEFESGERGERVALARKRQARNGDWGGGVRPYGWGVDTGRVRSVCINPKAPTMERIYEDRPVLDMTQHNEEEAREIARWADDLLAGVSMAQVLRDLADRDVQTVAQKEGRTIKRGGKQVEHRGWNRRTVVQILTHPRTAGHAVYRGVIVKRDAFPAIISESKRQALITLFADPRRKTTPGNTPKWLGSLQYLCGQCDNGTTMSVRNNSAGVPIYRCRDRGHCATPAVAADEYVEQAIIERLSRDDVADLLPQASTVDLEELRDRIVQCQKAKESAARLLVKGIFDEEQATIATQEADADLVEIRKEIAKATKSSPLAEFVTSENAAQTWEDLSRGRKREIIAELVTIRLLPAGRGFRPPIEQRVVIEPAPAPAPVAQAA
ncbi:recombinase family protein [Nonomuraea sp. NPDC049725]|uniref:recombinase family protein n=1 Tax=Nonomuraea sp. NPDC049725 TaxID=3154508 RepID=UPI00342D21CC